MAVTGRVLSLGFQGGLPAAVNRGTRVRGLHWEAGLQITDPDGNSHRPAIFARQKRVLAAIRIQIAGTPNTGAPATLRGQLGPLSLEGPVPLTDGTHSVTVTQTGALGTALTRHAGDVAWTVQGAPLPAPAVLDNQTFLEVFTVLGEPPPFFANGIWAEALRFLVQDVGLNGISDPIEALNQITRFCHRGHDLSYQSGGGAGSAFGVTYRGGSFDLTAFLERSPREVQCFDISAAVLVLAGAAGITGEWLQIDSFGYIHETSLVGIGACNNPFFIQYKTDPVIDRKAEERSSFEIHAFCDFSGSLFDACVGPHVGVTLQNYLADAVDPKNKDDEPLPPEEDLSPFTDKLEGVV
jgi:hypothetical protein